MVKEVINQLVNNAKVALDEFIKLDQNEVDEIVRAMALAGLENHMTLAKMAVSETGRGVYEDKVIKNLFATEYIYNDIKHIKTVRVLENNVEEGYMKVAEPIGVIAGVTPVTNPTSTTLFKAIIAAKTRNPIIFAFHPAAQNCSMEAAKIVRDAAIKHGAPENLIQWIETPSVEASGALMTHEGISLILATGGTSMVKSAYSSGNPAIGVGPGNVPCYIECTANIKQAVTDLIVSKTFDNGMICASEQGVIIDDEIYDEVVDFMKYNKCYFTTPEETELVSSLVIDTDKCAVNGDIVGKSPADIASRVGIIVPNNTKILCCELPDVGVGYPLSREKLSPVLAVFRVKNSDEGIELAEKMVELGGLGHSSVIHSNNDEVIKQFANRIKTGRILVNCPSSQGAIGDIYNTNVPSLTLGCGSYGKNSTTDNVSVKNLLNIKRVAKRKVNMQWFKIPPRIYFESGSIQYLEQMEDISKIFIVTDLGMVSLGYVDKIIHHLNSREKQVKYEIFKDVEPNPSFDTVHRGVKAMKGFDPDCIIALGGGSAIDAAKGMWLFYEYPDADVSGMKQKFMDIRKRIYRFPKLGVKCKFVAIPTTSGTGSEVTSFAVITDKANNIKYPLADYELTPDVAIIDPDLVMSLPKAITADTGLDALTHAIEAYVSVLASDYTDALAMKAIELIFEYLPRAYNDGNDKEAREKIHNASTIAGMAFTNAFLGVNHSLAHKLGGEFNISHGRSNAILLPHVIEYNGQSTPTKFVSFPKYEKYIAPKKYADISRRFGWPAYTDEEGVWSLINKIKELMKEVNIPTSIRECGVGEEEFMSKVEYLAERAFEDQCTTANPRLPLISELVEIYKRSY